MSGPQKVDVAVIGAGFAGSLAALGLARSADRRVVLLDRAAHPRHAIGESSTPIASLVLSDMARQYRLPELGWLAKHGPWRRSLPELRCGLKRGFAYFRHQADVPDSSIRDRLLVSANPDEPRGDTHWHRADVDHFLLRLAQRHGVICRHGVEVAVEAQGTRWLVSAGEVAESWLADFVIDASGGADVTGLASRRQRAWQTRTRAIYCHLSPVGSWHEQLAKHGGDVDRHPFPCDASAQHHLLDFGWVWILRFGEGLASVGLVEDLDHPRTVAAPGDDAAVRFRATVSEYPWLKALFASAHPDPPTISWTTSPEPLQRMAATMAGPNWALLPSAAGVVDPLHSTGIAHSLCGVERLVELLAEPSEAAREKGLRQYGSQLQSELEWTDLLVGACYRAMPNFRLFAAATMLYFAAATTYERLRSQHGRRPAFLCADDPQLRASVERWIGQLPDARRQSVSDADIQGLEAQLRRELQPYNHVGLCDPQADNLYRYEVA